MSEINRSELHDIIDVLPADVLGRAIDMLAALLPTDDDPRDPYRRLPAQLLAARFWFRPSKDRRLRLMDYALRANTRMRSDAIRAAEHWGDPELAPLLRAYANDEDNNWLRQDALDVAAQIEHES